MPANGNANPNNLPVDKAWFCPACGGADVTASGLAGGDASCNVCAWKGKVEELATFLFSHDSGTPDEILRRFFLDVRKLVSTHATELGQLLIKWGFIDVPTEKTLQRTQQLLARYAGACAQAIATSVVETRKAIEKEMHEKEKKYDNASD